MAKLETKKIRKKQKKFFSNFPIFTTINEVENQFKFNDLKLFTEYVFELSLPLLCTNYKLCCVRLMFPN